MEENRFEISGTVYWIGEQKQYSPFFKKRNIKIRINDVDFNGSIKERFILFGFINDNCELIEAIRLNDQVKIRFYIDGRDLEKDGKLMNFTSLVGYDVVIMRSESRQTEQDKKTVIGKEGLEYREPIKAATIDELINADEYNKHMIEPDPSIKFPNSEEKVVEVDNDMKTLFDDLPF